MPLGIHSESENYADCNSNNFMLCLLRLTIAFVSYTDLYSNNVIYIYIIALVIFPIGLDFLFIPFLLQEC